jgi:hypothetical protein
MEFDVVVEVFGDATENLIFRKVINILQFLKKTVEPIWHESQKEKPSDLVSTVENAFTLEPHPRLGDRGKFFGFLRKTAASMIESIAAAAETKTKDLWFDSKRRSFMEVEFKRPRWYR